MEKTVSISKRTKNLIDHITSGLKERNEIMALSLLSSVAGENFCLFGPEGTGKESMLKKLKSAFSGRLGVKVKIFETPSDYQELCSSWEDSLLHLAVNPIQDNQAFLKLITSKKSDSEILKSEEAIMNEELKEWDSLIEEVKIPGDIQEILTSVRKKLGELNYKNEESEISENFYISDSRWIRIARLLKTSAFLNGRKSVDFMDCELISRCIWKIKKNSAQVADTENQVAKIVEESILEFSLPFLDEIEQVKELIKDYENFTENAFYIEENGKKIKNPALFGYIKPSEPNTFKMTDGTLAYRIMHPEEIRSYDYITPQYVSKEFSLYKEGHGAYFDLNKVRIAKNDRYRDKYFVQNLRVINGNAVWTDGDFKHEYSFRVQMIPENFIKGDEEKLADLQNQAQEKYDFVTDAIEKTRDKIQKFVRAKERQFKSNLFSKKATLDAVIEKLRAVQEMAEKLECIK